MNPLPLQLTAQADLSLFPATEYGKESTQRIVEWVLQAEVAPEAERVPLNLALVVDRSGSMAGDKLENAKQAAARLLDFLDDRDRVALVAFSDEVALLSPSLQVTPGNRNHLKRQILSLQTEGCTDLSGGYFKGALEVAEHLEQAGAHRVLLLSDGAANRGITDTGALCRHASELLERGVSTSTFGIGLGYNEYLLEGMAAAGGGRFFFIEQAHQIEAALHSELEAMLHAVALNVTLAVDAPEGLWLQFFGGLPCQRTQAHFELPLGSFYSGERREFYTGARASVPHTAGDTLRLTGHIQGEDPHGRPFHSPVELTFAFASQAEVDAAPVDHGLLSRSATVTLAEAATQAQRMEREGRGKEGAEMLRSMIATVAPNAAPADVMEYLNTAAQVEQGLSEYDRKSLHMREYRKRHKR